MILFLYLAVFRWLWLIVVGYGAPSDFSVMFSESMILFLLFALFLVCFILLVVYRKSVRPPSPSSQRRRRRQLRQLQADIYVCIGVREERGRQSLSIWEDLDRSRRFPGLCPTPIDSRESLR